MVMVMGWESASNLASNDSASPHRSVHWNWVAYGVTLAKEISVNKSVNLIILINIEQWGYGEDFHDRREMKVRIVLIYYNSLYAMAYSIKSTYIAKFCSVQEKHI
jgi:hypothetical protein